jgi:hypothetical protein
MLWITLIAAMVILAATASLFGSWHTRRDVASGRPSYLSLADLTGIWDRRELARLCGPPDEDDRYSLSVETAARLPRKKWLRYFDAPLLDLACILGAGGSIWMGSNQIAAFRFVVVAGGLYQLVSWSVAAWQVLKNTPRA